MTVAKTLEKIKNELKQAGIYEYNIEAYLIMEHATGLSKAQCFLYNDRELDEEETLKIESTVKRRVTREPLQYILGETEFMGLKIKVNENVLIPRFDTEVLVEETLKRIRKNMRILEIGCGSGCVISALYHFNHDENVSFEACDISKKALSVAEENIKNLGMDIKLQESDLFENIRGKYDIILSNPPYIKSEVIEGLEKEVKNFEPRLALDGGKDGLCFYEKIISQASQFLNDEGWLIFEIGYDQRDELTLLMKNNNYREIECVKDLSGNDRVIIGKKGC